MSKEIDLDFERETEKDREEEKQNDSDYEHLNDKINAIDDRVTELEQIGGSRILMQGGVNPSLGMNYYLNLNLSRSKFITYDYEEVILEFIKIHMFNNSSNSLSSIPLKSDKNNKKLLVIIVLQKLVFNSMLL